MVRTDCLRNLLLLGLCLFALQTQAESMLFNQGKTNYSIIISPTASVSEQTAAKELQSYLLQISNAHFPISTQLTATGKHIYVGYNETVGALLGVDCPKDNDEAFCYTTVGNQLFIYGGKQRGTMYGVYSFLENELGIHWLAPDCTVVPKRQSWILPELSRQESPAAQYRYDEYYGFCNIPDLYARNKMNMVWESENNSYGNLHNYWLCHSSQHIVPPEKYFASHPEYYSLRNGKRIRNSQLCLSNPDVLNIVKQRLHQAIRPNSRYWCFDVSQNDNELYCECKNCQRLEKRYGGHSGIWIWFVNQVAAEFPDTYIGTFAYQYTRKAPKNIRPLDNVVIRLCSQECCFAHPIEQCQQNKAFMSDLKAWSKLTRNLYIWDYTINFANFLAPLPNFDVMAPNIKTFQKYGAIAIHESGEYRAGKGAFAELKAWLFAKLLWNPQQDVDSLASIFIQGYYQEAATDIEKYYHLNKKLVTEDQHWGIYNPCTSTRFSTDFIQSSITLLRGALKKCKTPEVSERVERVLLQPLYLQYRIDKPKALSTGNAADLLRIVKQQEIYINEALTSDIFLQREGYI